MSWLSSCQRLALPQKGVFCLQDFRGIDFSSISVKHSFAVFPLPGVLESMRLGGERTALS